MHTVRGTYVGCEACHFVFFVDEQSGGSTPLDDNT
jgi:hypothetical protein